MPMPLPLTRRLWGELTEGSATFSWLSVRFVDAAVEDLFARERCRAKGKAFLALTLATAVYLLMYSVYRQMNDMSQNNAAERRINTIHGYMDFSGSFSALFVATTLGIVRRCPSRRRFVLFEVCTLLASVCGVFGIVLNSEHYMAVLLGYNPDELFRQVRSSDTIMVLTICSFVSISLYASPVRWHVQASTCVAAVVAYGMALFVLGSPESNVFLAHQV